MRFVSCADHQHALCLRVFIETNEPVLVVLYGVIQLIENELMALYSGSSL